jgi:hypothetical protein
MDRGEKAGADDEGSEHRKREAGDRQRQRPVAKRIAGFKDAD